MLSFMYLLKSASERVRFFCLLSCSCDEAFYFKEYNGEEGANGSDCVTE